MKGNHLSAALAPGLDLFAASWLQEWCEAGGWATLAPGGGIALGFREFKDCPEDIVAASHLPETVKVTQRAFRDGCHTGRVRGLLRLIEGLPHGRDALGHHMQIHGLFEYGGQSSRKA